MAEAARRGICCCCGFCAAWRPDGGLGFNRTGIVSTAGAALATTTMRSLRPPVGATPRRHCLVSAFSLRPLWPSGQPTAPTACRRRCLVACTVSVADAASATSAVAATSARAGDLVRQRPSRAAYGPSRPPPARPYGQRSLCGRRSLGGLCSRCDLCTAWRPRPLATDVAWWPARSLGPALSLRLVQHLRPPRGLRAAYHLQSLRPLRPLHDLHHSCDALLRLVEAQSNCRPGMPRRCGSISKATARNGADAFKAPVHFLYGTQSRSRL
jgi:hypothetical protein